MFIQNMKNNEDFKYKFEKAILVGSSGDLLNKESSDFINSFPVVIRMNDSPIYNFEKDVGNKTTIRIVNFKAIGNVLNPNFLKEFVNTEYLILCTNNHNDRYKFQHLSRLFPKLKLYIFTPYAIEYNDKLFLKYTKRPRKQSGSWITTGWMSLFFLINYVKEKHIIGFGGEYPNSKYHYYSKSNLTQKSYYIQHETSSNGHRFITEKDVFVKWIQEFNLIFHKL